MNKKGDSGMTNPIERAVQMLFPENGPQTRNVKFLCAGTMNVTAEALAEHIVRAEVQIRGDSSHYVQDVDGHLTAH
jgi:hypothetical protein